MKTTKSFAIFFLAVFCCTVNISCKKLLGENDKHCQVSSATFTDASGSSLYTISWNNDGKVSTINLVRGAATTNKVFNYSGNTIIINSTLVNGTYTYHDIDSITVDGQGRALNVRSFQSDRSSWVNSVFEYNGEDLYRIIQTSSNAATPQISTATYSNGNMVKLQSANGATTLEYYTNEKVQPGDYLEFATVTLYGITLYPHKNLVKTLDDGNGNISNFSYEKNSDGYITKVTNTSGTDINSLSYQYKCD